MNKIGAKEAVTCHYKGHHEYDYIYGTQNILFPCVPPLVGVPRWGVGAAATGVRPLCSDLNDVVWREVAPLEEEGTQGIKGFMRLAAAAARHCYTGEISRQGNGMKVHNTTLKRILSRT